MCILVTCDPGTIPTREELVMGVCSNPHGFGYAIVIDGELVVNRSMEADGLIDEFLALREENMNATAIFHARYASQGSVDIDNCHPFYLGDDKQTVLAHNGNLPNEEQPKGDNRSDTRWFAEDKMPELGGVTSLDDPKFYEQFKKWSGSNRIAFLTVNPEAKKELYLIGEELGSVDADGVWWSNTYHRSARYSAGASSKFGDTSNLNQTVSDLQDEYASESKDDYAWMDSLTEKEWDALLKAQSRNGFQYSQDIAVF